MARFELTAELDLQAPNLGRTINDLRRQLNGIDIDVSIVNGRRSARQIGEINRRLDETNNLTSSLVKNLGVSVRRFTAFAIATRTVSLFTNTLGKATEEAIEFEKELIKISQVSGKTLSELQGLENTITTLSTSLGTSSKNLLSATRILAQAGIEAGRLDVALDALAKTTLAPTFEDIEKTAEGAVAILSQFERGVGALSEQLGAINAVAGQFAVESGDLISAVRRTGGVFKSAGGDLNELLALFTSVRATTRESAESIATGLRTIFTRIQRPKTIEFLKQFGVELTDLNGKFIGPFEAVKRLSQALAGLEEGDIQFVRIAEELGGFRQIGKVIPLIQQFETAERARQAAIEGGTSLDRDAITAQQSLSNQFEKTREKFLALIRSIADTGTFQTSIRTVLKLADSFIDLADAIKPILPLIGAIGAFSAVRGLAGFGRNFTAGFTGQRRNQGGPIQAFATGGMVPGTGNRDTVPAMLTPGEFVIRKSSVESIGAENLARMNRGGVARYRKGTKKKGAQKKDIQQGETVKIKGDSPSNPIIGQIAPGGTPGVSTDGKYETTLSKLGIRLREGEKPNTKVVVRANVDKNVLAPKDVGFEETVSKSLNKVQPVLDSAASKAFDLKTKSKVADDKKAVDSISGFLFESFASAVAGKASGDKNPFDFIGEKRSKQISKFADADPIAELLDAKNTFVNPGQIIKKAVDYKKGEGKSDNRLKFIRSNRNFFGGAIQKFAKGGGVEGQKRNAYIFDFDDTLATTEAKGFKEFSDPKFVKSASATRYASLAKRRASQGDDIHVLTARSGGGGIRQAIAEFMASSGIPTKSIIAVGKAFPKEREPGKRPGTTRKLSTASKKAKVLSKLSQNYNKITFLDDNAENLIQASKVKGVSAVEAKSSKLFKNKKAFGGLIQKFGAGGTVKAGDLRRGDILDTGEIVRGALAVGNRTKRRVSLTLEKDGNKKTETVDFYKKFGLKSKGKAIEPIKLAAGGIVDQKAAGAAILDPEPASSKSVSIGVEDVKKKFSEFSKLAKGKDPVSKFYKSTSFDVTKSGLNKETSDKFKVALEDGLISGVNTSASILANDLGTPNAKIDQSQATNFVKGINTQVFGRLFETTVDSIKRQGNYDKPDNNPNRPFDAEQGLPSVLKDNFKGLPDKFIDLKTSAAAASDANLKGKILDQIKIELIRDGILNADYPGKAGKDKDRTAREVKDEKQRQADKAVGRGFPARRNAGGPAPSDTVPALLTPGEFVFSKEASQRIGYGNLDRMNKKGVQGFAAGGAVQVARYNAGTGPSGVDLSDINNFGGDSPRSFPIPTGGLERLDAAANDAADANENGRQATEERSKADVFAALSVATSFIPRSEDASSAMGRFQNSILDSITTVSASIAALEAFNIKLLASGDQGSLLTGLGRRGQVGTQKFGRKVAGAIPGVSARGAVRFGKALSKVTTVASRALGPFVAVAAATKLVSNSFDALAGRAKAVEDAIQAGSPDDAAKAAASQQTAKDAGTVAAGFAGAGAAIGSLIAPGIGTAIGAVIGGVGGLIAKETGALDSFGDDLRDNVIAPFTGNTRELISIQSREAANRVKIEKELQKATKKSAQTLEAFAEGGATLEEAISALSGGLKEELALLQSKETLNKAEIKAQEGRGVLGFFGEDVEKTSQLKESNKKIEEQRTKIVTDAFKKGVSSDIIRKAINERIARGEPVDVDDLINQLIPEGARESLDEKDIENARTKLNNMANAAQRNADFIKSLNFGLRDVSSSIGATSLAVKNSLATFEPGFNSLALSASTLEAAITSAGAGIDQSSIDKSLSDLEAQFIKFGGDPKQVNQLSETIKALNDLQRAGPELLSGIKDELTANLNTNPQQIRDALSNQLLQSVPEGSDLRRRLEDNIRGLKIDDEVRSLITSGNLEGLLEKILGPLGESAKKQLANFTEIGKLQEQLNPLIKKRIDLENKLVSAQKQSLDIQLEAAKAIESFGGATVTSGDKLSILDKKLELDLGNAGFGGAIGSSPKDLIRVNQELKNAYEKAVNSSREGQGGLESQAQAKNIESAQKSLLDNLRGRIKLAQQEIDIAKKKNELEKSALQKLIEGDAIGFFEEQQVASASRALSRGDERSIRQFTQDVIGKAFAKLQSDDTLSDRDRRRAARSALPFGFQSQRNIGILSETTPELRRLKDAGIEAAEALSLIGESLSDFREADIGVVKGDIKKVEGIIQDPTRQQTTTTGNTPPAQLAKGGVVYANEGAFIPKGTDTVPAMLTPGEYVVNSKAVQSGNNLSVLQSMNSGKTVYANRGGFISDVVSLAGLKPADVLGVAGAYYSLGLYQPSSDRAPTAQQKASQKQVEEEIQKEIAEQEKIAADKKRKAAEREAARKKIVELYNRIRGGVNYAAETASNFIEYYREQAAIRREQADIREADQKKLDRYKLDVQTYNEQKKAYEKDQAKRRKFGLGQDDNGKEIFEIKRPNIAAYRDPRDKKPYKITLDSISIFSDSPDSALIPYGAKVEDNRSKEEKLAIKNNLELGNAYKKGTFDEEEFNQRKSKGGFKSISSYEEYLKLREIPFRENRSRYLQRQQAKINETKDSFYDESARRYDSAERKLKISRAKDEQRLQVAIAAGNTKQVERLERKIAKDQEKFKSRYGRANNRSGYMRLVKDNVNNERERRLGNPTVGLDQRVGVRDFSGYNDALVEDRIYTQQLKNKPDEVREPQLALKSGTTKGGYFNEQEQSIRNMEDRGDIPREYGPVEDTEQRKRSGAGSGIGIFFSKGGPVYASRGQLIPKSIFQPRGTDTVPAMLTPGEFVVNRQAVRAGNNLAVLQEMNSRPAAPVTPTATMSRGGQVGNTQYLQNGGEVSGGAQDNSYLKSLESQLATLAQKLESGFSTFGQHVESFQSATNTEMMVNVNQTGSMRVEAGSTLSNSLMKNSKDIAMSSVNGQIDRASIGLDGKMRTTNSVLG